MGVAFATIDFVPGGTRVSTLVFWKRFIEYGRVGVFPTVSLVSNGTMELLGNSCTGGAICGSGPLDIIGSFGRGSTGFLRLISLSNTGDNGASGFRAIGGVASRNNVFIRVNNNVEGVRAISGCFSIKISHMVVNATTMADPSFLGTTVLGCNSGVTIKISVGSNFITVGN